MIITREQLPKLSEDLLRREVLIPLFRAMGYQDVFHHHGGALEQGKDIVMWKGEDFRARVNYAVVAKKGDLTGRVTGRGSAGEVEMQVRQCFGSSYKDPTSGEEQKVHKCLVVSSGSISTEFINAVHGALAQSGLDRDTDFIDGDKLFANVEKVLPQKTASVFSRVHDLQEFLAQQASGFATTITSSGDETSISFRPVDEKTAGEAGAVSVNAFGEAGSQARQKFEQFLRTGEPFTLRKGEFDSVELPAMLEKIWGISLGDLDEISVRSSDNPPVSFTIRRVCEDGDSGELPNVELAAVKKGSEQVTLSNERQNAPWTITILMWPYKMQLSYRVRLVGGNVMHALRWLQFQRALAKPGVIILQQVENGIEHQTAGEPACSEPPDPRVVALVEKLVLIQKRTGTLLNLPATFSVEEEDQIARLFGVITTGRLPLRSIRFSLKKGSLRKNREVLDKPGTFRIEFDEDELMPCLGAKIAVGPKRIVCSDVRLSSSIAKSFAAELSEGSDEDEIFVEFEGSAEQPIEALYTRWLKD